MKRLKGLWGYAAILLVSAIASAWAIDSGTLNVGKVVFFGSSSGSASVTVGSAAGTPTTLVLPTADATASQYLQNDGAGNLSWATPAGSGTVTVSGAGSLTSHGVVVGAGTTVEKTIAALTDGQLVVGATGADPAPQTMSGDATLASTGALTVKTSIALAGSPTTTTQAAKDNTTKIATTAYVDRQTDTTLSSGTLSFTAPRKYIVCTTTCTITVPAPVAGDEFCVQNNVAISSVITLAAIGSAAAYGKTDQSAYGTAGTGTAVASGATGDKICLLGIDSTHYNVASFSGAWTMN